MLVGNLVQNFNTEYRSFNKYFCYQVYYCGWKADKNVNECIRQPTI